MSLQSNTLRAPNMSEGQKRLLATITTQAQMWVNQLLELPEWKEESADGQLRLIAYGYVFSAVAEVAKRRQSGFNPSDGIWLHQLVEVALADLSNNWAKNNSQPPYPVGSMQ